MRSARAVGTDWLENAYRTVAVAVHSAALVVSVLRDVSHARQTHEEDASQTDDSHRQNSTREDCTRESRVESTISLLRVFRSTS